MSIMIKIMKNFVYLFLFFIFPTNAYAYLDPGTGSIIIQSIIAAMAAGLFALSGYWNKIKSFFKKNKKKDKEIKK